MREVISQPNTRSNAKVAKPQVFNNTLEKILDLIIAYKLFLRIRMRKAVVEEQIQ